MSHVSIRMLVGWEDENLEGARHHSQTISLLLLLSSLIFLYGTMRTYPFTTYLGMLGRKKGQGLLASFSFTFFFFFFFFFALPQDGIWTGLLGLLFFFLKIP